MAYKSILVHAEPGHAGDRRVASAAAAARMFGAQLIGLGAVAVELIVNSAYAAADGEVINAVLERVTADLPAAERRFWAVAGPLAQDLAWVAEEDYPNRAMCRHGRGADLTVASRVNRKDGASFVCRPIDLIVEAGGPVLLVNDHGPQLVAENVIVAWKDTREARRALTDSLPFLQRAGKVVIVHARESADRGPQDADLGEIVDRLARHGVKATVEVLDKSRHGAARAIEAAADRHGADLVVAGAFSRSRVTEWVLGGVTQDLAEFSTKFVLFSH